MAIARRLLVSILVWAGVFVLNAGVFILFLRHVFQERYILEPQMMELDGQINLTFVLFALVALVPAVAVFRATRNRGKNT